MVLMEVKTDYKNYEFWCHEYNIRKAKADNDDIEIVNIETGNRVVINNSDIDKQFQKWHVPEEDREHPCLYYFVFVVKGTNIKIDKNQRQLFPPDLYQDGKMKGGYGGNPD